MNVYHELSPDAIDSVLTTGLKKTSRGEKGDDTAIKKTDAFLDDCRSQNTQNEKISRNDNIYAYMATDTHIIDITDGSHIPIEDFLKQSDRTVVRLSVNATKCFVSDIDLYDAIKDALENNIPVGSLKTLAERYWNSVTPLADYSVDMFQRPEIMITYDISPDKITVMTS